MKKNFLKSWIYALFTLFLLFFGNIFVNADDNWFQVPTQNWGQKQTWWQKKMIFLEKLVLETVLV